MNEEFPTFIGLDVSLRPTTLSIICAIKDLITAGREASFRRMIQSIEAEAPEPVEILIIDSASTDGTLELVEECKGERHAYTVISEPDKGIYEGYQKGVDASTGVWLNFMNSDDYFESGGLDAFFSAANGTADLLYGATVFDNGGPKRPSKPKMHRLLVGMALCTQSCFFRKASVVAAGGFDTGLKILGDYDLTMRGLIAGWKFTKLKATISVFKIGGASAKHIEIARGELQTIWQRTYKTPHFNNFENTRPYTTREKLSKRACLSLIRHTPSLRLKTFALRELARV